MNSNKALGLFCVVMSTLILVTLIAGNLTIPQVHANLMQFSHNKELILWGFPIVALIFGIFLLSRKK
jgi:hypothetical protein